MLTQTLLIMVGTTLGCTVRAPMELQAQNSWIIVDLLKERYRAGEMAQPLKTRLTTKNIRINPSAFKLFNSGMLT